MYIHIFSHYTLPSAAHALYIIDVNVLDFKQKRNVKHQKRRKYCCCCFIFVKPVLSALHIALNSSPVSVYVSVSVKDVNKLVARRCAVSSCV